MKALKNSVMPTNQRTIEHLKNIIPDAIAEIQFSALENGHENLCDEIRYCEASPSSHINDICNNGISQTGKIFGKKFSSFFFCFCFNSVLYLDHALNSRFRHQNEKKKKIFPR